MKYFVVIVGVLALLAMGHAQSDEGEATTVAPSDNDDSAQPSPPVPPPRPPIRPFDPPRFPNRPPGLNPPPRPNFRRPGQQQNSGPFGRPLGPNGLNFGPSQGPFGRPLGPQQQRPGPNSFNFGVFQGPFGG